MRSSFRTAHLPVCCSRIGGTPAQASALQPTRSPGSGRPGPLFSPPEVGEARVEPTLRQACSRPRPRAQFAFKDSMIHIICNSHYVSHFAAFFIDTGAKISVVESCLWFLWRRRTLRARRARRLQISSVTDRLGLFPAGDPRESSAASTATSSLGPAPPFPPIGRTGRGSGRTLERRPPLPFGRDRRRHERAATLQRGETGVRVERWFDRCNDPSAGSPTETLLRLLLPLGGRV